MTNTAVMALEAGNRVAEELRGRLKMKGVLVEMAKLGQIIELRCEMPQCYCPKGRTHFDPRSKTPTDWAPNPDHHPIPRRAKGTLQRDNVRLAHVFCNRNRDGWHTRIAAMLGQDMSLDQIAKSLNRRKVPRPDGQAAWTARFVRKVFVS